MEFVFMGKIIVDLKLNAIAVTIRQASHFGKAMIIVL